MITFPLSPAHVQTLPNGLTLILDPDASAPVISTQLWVKTGSIHEDQFLGTGLSHFLEHMVFKGTKDFSAAELADTVQAAGGHWNAYTSFDRTVYYIDGPAHSLDTFLKCLTGIVFFPTLPESEFEKEKEVIRREIDMGLDDPYHSCFYDSLNELFLADPRRFPVIGHRHLFDSLSYQNLVDYHRKRYSPHRSFLVISGDFDPSSAASLVSTLTQSLTLAPGPEPHLPTDPPQVGPRYFRNTFAIPNSKITLAWRIPPLLHPDYPSFTVLASILGSGSSSIFYQKLREQSDLALEISCSTMITSNLEAIFSIQAEATTEKRDALIQAIHEVLDSLAQTDLSKDLDKAKRKIAINQFKPLTSASGRASNLASNWFLARDINFTRTYLENIHAVTLTDVLRAASQLSRSLTTLTILDPLDSTPLCQHVPAPHCAHEFSLHTLKNGIQVALVPDHRVPLFYINATVRGGAVVATPSNQGINQLHDSTLTKGTLSRSAKEIADTLEALGASCSASSNFKTSTVSAKGLSADLPTILEIFADILCSPAFPTEAIEREKTRQLAELDEASQDPFHLCYSALLRDIYPHIGYGLDSLGTHDSVAALTQNDLLLHHRSLYNTQNTTLCIAGSFDPSEVISLLDSFLLPYPQGNRLIPPSSSCHYGNEIHQSLQKKQAVLVIAYPGLALNDPNRFCLSFISEYASDMAGPLFTRIREELGLAYQVGCSHTSGFDSGFFSFYLATAPEHLELAKSELLKEIQQIATHGIPPESLERVRAKILSQYAINLQSSSAIANDLAFSIACDLPTDLLKSRVNIYQKMTGQEILTVAQQIFSATPTISMVSSESSTKS